LQAGLCLAGLCQAELQSNPYVGQIRPQVQQPLRLPGTHHRGVGPQGQLMVVVTVPAPQRLFLPGFGQAQLTVLANGLQQPVPHPCAVLFAGQNRLVDQASH